MQTDDLTKAYAAKADGELLQLATESEQLTPEARVALMAELAKRRIDSPEHLEVSKEGERPWTRPPLALGDSQSVGEFVAEIHRVYFDQFWLCVKLTAPSVVAGWIAISLDRYEIREIGQHLRVGSETLKLGILKIWLVNSAQALVIWMAFAFSLGAISIAMRKITRGVVPSVADIFAEIRERTGPFLRISLLLFLLLLVTFAVFFMLSGGVFWVLGELHVHPTHFKTLVNLLVGGLMGLVLLIFSRFVLAMPAVILDDCKVLQALFRSDELTEGKWLTLAVLLADFAIGSYIAGMWPFWLASWIPANIALPPWFPWILTVVSIAGVTVVDATVFIGFALLYLRMSALATSSEALARQ